jgi:hypothetical protein
VKATASLELRCIRKAVAAAREIVWAAAPPGGITIDIDATLLNLDYSRDSGMRLPVSA